MSVVDDYLSNVAEPQRAELERIRKIVKQTAPEAEEAISYGMPAFKYKGKYFVGFAAFRDHLGFFPTPTPIEAFKNKLKEFKTAKGTIQFTPDHPIPEPLIKDIVLYKIAEIDKSKS